MSGPSPSPTPTSTWFRSAALGAAGALAAAGLLASCATLPAPPGGGSPAALGGVLTEDLALAGPATLAEDLLIPEGVTLTLLPGATVTVVPSEGTLTHPPFLLGGTEIVVHGALRAPRSPGGAKAVLRPAPFAEGKPGSWGGIVLAGPAAQADLANLSLEGAESGVLDFRSPASTHPRPLEVGFREDAPALPPSAPRTREYLGDAALTEDTVWSGEVVVAGQVTVPPGVTLTVRPGARVLFRFRDSDRDRLGESWIVVQGRLRVEGSEDAWVLFDAEDPAAGPGAWDSVSLISSDAPDNLVAYAVFRRAVKGFHDHFSRVALEHVHFTDNLRGLQFQESEGLTLDQGTFRGNRSALRFRDSTVALSNLVVDGNISGANFLRSKVTVRDSLFTGNRFESLQSREAETALLRCAFVGNRQGPRFKGSGTEPASLDSCLAQWNLQEGLSLSRVRAQVDRCEISDNGEAGLAVTDAQAKVRGSRIAGNGRWEVDNNGLTDVDAEGNDWGRPGGADLARFSDGRREKGRGVVKAADPLPVPFRLAFPGSPLPLGGFDGLLLVAGDVTVPRDLTLSLLPGARVLFAPAPPGSLFDLCSDHPSFPGGELLVAGEISALGTSSRLVTFAPLEEGTSPGSGEAAWGAVNLFNSSGGVFRHCLFTGADTGLHAAGVRSVSVEACRFEGNLSGVRFSDAKVTVRGSTFRANRWGLRFHDKGGSIEGNEFYQNTDAVFVTGPFSRVEFTGNTFAGSGEYDVKLGVGADTDLDMRKNRFLSLGTGRKPEELVFDQARDPDLGRVLLP